MKGGMLYLGGTGGMLLGGSVLRVERCREVGQGKGRNRCR